MSFSFMNPVAFLFLLLLPFFYSLKKIGLFSHLNFPLTFADWKGFVFSWNNKFLRIVSAFSSILILLAFLLVVVALAEPALHRQERVYTTRGTDILFVLDTSPSMAARDINGMLRIDAAKNAIDTLVQNNEGASYGLLAMGSEAALLVPTTMDTEYFKSRLVGVRLGEMGDGTAIGTGLGSAVYHLSESKAARKCIVLLTDGENNAGEIHPETAQRIAQENGITLYTVGIGTRGSVPLDYKDPYSGKEYSGFLDSSFDSGPLEKIALESGGRYYGVESIGALSSALSAITKRQSVVQSYYLRNVDTLYYDTFLLMAIIAFAAAWFIRRFLLKEFM